MGSRPAISDLAPYATSISRAKTPPPSLLIHFTPKLRLRIPSLRPRHMPLRLHNAFRPQDVIRRIAPLDHLRRAPQHSGAQHPVHPFLIPRPQRLERPHDVVVKSHCQFAALGRARIWVGVDLVPPARRSPAKPRQSLPNRELTRHQSCTNFKIRPKPPVQTLTDIPQVAGPTGKARCFNALWQRFWRSATVPRREIGPVIVLRRRIW